MNLAPQLGFAGTCRQAFEFYAALLGGKIAIMNTFGGNDAKLPPGSAAAGDDKIRFAELSLGDQAIRGNDLPDGEAKPMTGFNLSLHLRDPAVARRVFDGLAAGGRVSTPLARVEWADLFGMVTDRFGVPWLILAVKD